MTLEWKRWMEQRSHARHPSAARGTGVRKAGARAVLGVPWKVTLIGGLGMADAVTERFEGMVSYADPPLTF